MSDISCRNRASAAGTFKSGLFWNVNLNEALFLSQAQSIADDNKKLRLEAYISTFQSVPLLPVPPGDFQDVSTQISFFSPPTKSMLPPPRANVDPFPCLRYR
jgi:hypothetical protein